MVWVQREATAPKIAKTESTLHLLVCPHACTPVSNTTILTTYTHTPISYTTYHICLYQIPHTTYASIKYHIPHTPKSNTTYAPTCLHPSPVHTHPHIHPHISAHLLRPWPLPEEAAPLRVSRKDVPVWFSAIHKDYDICMYVCVSVCECVWVSVCVRACLQFFIAFPMMYMWDAAVEEQLAMLSFWREAVLDCAKKSSHVLILPNARNSVSKQHLAGGTHTHYPLS